MFFGVDDLPRVRRWVRLSTRELADRAGIAPAALSKIETGRKSLSSENRVRLSNALAARLKELRREGQVDCEQHGLQGAAA